MAPKKKRLDEDPDVKVVTGVVHDVKDLSEVPEAIPRRKGNRARTAQNREDRAAGRRPPAPSVPMREMPNGGKLQSGAPGKHVVRNPMPGIPAAHIRNMLRGSYLDRLSILEKIIDGEAVEKTVVTLEEVLEHAWCPHCKGRLKPLDPEGKPRLITLKALRSARVMERLAAMDQLAKYGLGTTRELSAEEVKERLVLTIQVINNLLAPQDAKRVLEGIRHIWAG